MIYSYVSKTAKVFSHFIKVSSPLSLFLSSYAYYLVFGAFPFANYFNVPMYVVKATIVSDGNLFNYGGQGTRAHICREFGAERDAYIQSEKF